MTEHVKVKSVGEGRPWKDDITYWEVTLERNGSDFECTWGKKGDAPQPNEEVEGEFFQKNNEWRFRKASAKPGSGGGQEATATSPRSPGGPTTQYQRPKTPEEKAEMRRSHSQEMTLRFLALSNFRVDATDDGAVERSLEYVAKLTDFFDQNVIQAGQAATSAQGADESRDAGSLPSPSVSPESSSQSAGDTAQYFTGLLEAAHMDRVAALELGKFIAAKFSDEQRKRAENGLRELESQQDTVNRLTLAYEKSEAKLLPRTGDDEEALPF